MKKVILLGLLIVSSVFAKVEYFGGIGLGTGTLGYNITATRNSDNVVAATSSNTTNGTATSINVGSIIDKTHKTLVAYTKFNSSESVSASSTAVAYEYLIYNLDPHWKPSIGGGLSIIQWSETTKDTSSITWDSDKIAFDTVVISGRLGADYVINKTSFLSLIYNVGLSVNGSVDTGLTISGTPYTTNVEMSKANQFSITYNQTF